MLKDEKTSIGFRAHPTSQGLPKVKEFSKKMPEVLEFDLCPYKDFLRTVFKGYDLDEEDIGLYFFPDSMKRSMAYISHLEKLSEQYFMRSCIDGVELLVFTSKVLHKDYRMRNKYDFLWGIYRRRHGKKLKDAVEGTMVVDMDIDAIEVDMVAGETVGRVDVVVPGAYGISGAEANTIIYDDWGWAVGKRARLEEGIDVAGYHVSAEAMETLAPSRWIEDNIIHAYMTLLRQREQDIEDAPQWERKPSYFFADTFFMEFGKKIMYDFSQMNEEEAKKARPSVHKFFIDFATSDVGPAIHEVDYIFVAGHVDGNHWVLFVFFVKTWQFMVLDPKYDNMHYVKELKVMEFLVPEMLRFFRKGNHFSEGNAQCFLFRERPKQQNSDDCGIYIMKYMDYLLQGYDLTLVSWSTEDVETFRYRITMEIQKGKARPIPKQNMHNRLANSS